MKIKNCPLCNTKAKFFPFNTYTVPLKKGMKRKKFIFGYFIQCINLDCGCRVYRLKKKEVFKIWNKRIK